MQSDSGPSNTRQYAVKPAKRLRYQVKKIGLRKLMRQGLGRRIPQKIWHLEPVKVSTLHEYERAIRQFTCTTRGRKSARL
jgi:hypothetical protein